MELTVQYFGVLQRGDSEVALPSPLSDTWEAATAHGCWSLGLIDEIGLVSLEAGIAWLDAAGSGSSRGNPLFTVFVEGSDYALLSIAGREKRHMVVNPPRATDYEWGAVALRLAGMPVKSSWDLSDWLEEVGVEDSLATGLIERLATEEFRGAERAAWAFLDALGLYPEVQTRDPREDGGEDRLWAALHALHNQRWSMQ